jgi:hypothetical protein
MRIIEAPFSRLYSSFSAKLTLWMPSKHLSELVKPHVAPYGSFSILRPKSGSMCGLINDRFLRQVAEDAPDSSP